MVPSKTTIEPCEPWYALRGPAVTDEVHARRARVCHKIGSWHEQVDVHNQTPARIPSVPPIDQHLRNSMPSRRRAATPQPSTPPAFEVVAPPRAGTPQPQLHVAASFVAAPAVPPRAATPPKASPNEPPAQLSASSTADDWWPAAAAGDAASRAKQSMAQAPTTAAPRARGRGGGKAPGQGERWSRWKAMHQRTLPKSCFANADTAVDTDLQEGAISPAAPQSLVPKKLHARLSEKLEQIRQVASSKVPCKLGNDRLDVPVKSATYKKGHAGVLSKLLMKQIRAGNLTAEPPREAFFQAW